MSRQPTSTPHVPPQKPLVINHVIWKRTFQQLPTVFCARVKQLQALMHVTKLLHGWFTTWDLKHDAGAKTSSPWQRKLIAERNMSKENKEKKKVEGAMTREEIWAIVAAEKWKVARKILTVKLLTLVEELLDHILQAVIDWRVCPTQGCRVDGRRLGWG